MAANKKAPISPPARTDEEREDELICLAENLAEEKLRNGTAGTQIIVHYLKRGSAKERIEEEILMEQKKLITAKTEAIETQKRTDELYAKALQAMSSYNGEEYEGD